MLYNNIKQHSKDVKRASAFYPKLPVENEGGIPSDANHRASKRMSRFIVNNPIADLLQQDRGAVVLTLPSSSEINEKEETKYIATTIKDTLKLYKPTAYRLFKFVGFYVLGILVYRELEGWNFQDSVYFITQTISTVGYGNIYPVTQGGQIFTFFYLYSGIILVFTIFGETLHAFVMFMRSNYKKPLQLNKVQVFVRSAINLGMWLIILFSIPIMGGVFFHLNEGWEFQKAMWFSIYTVASIGYGDLQVAKSSSVWFNCFYIIIGVSLTAVSLDKISSFKRHLYEAELWQILDAIEPSKALLDAINPKEMQATRSEYILHMLQLEGKLDYLNDIARWKEKFDEFDLDKDGVLTINDCINYAKAVKRRMKGPTGSRQMKKRSIIAQVSDETKAVLLETIGMKHTSAEPIIQDENAHENRVYGTPKVRAKALKRASTQDNSFYETKDIEAGGNRMSSIRTSVEKIFQSGSLFGSNSGSNDQQEGNATPLPSSSSKRLSSNVKNTNNAIPVNGSAEKPTPTRSPEKAVVSDSEVPRTRESVRREFTKSVSLQRPTTTTTNSVSSPTSPNNSNPNNNANKGRATLSFNRESLSRPKSKNYTRAPYKDYDVEL